MKTSELHTTNVLDLTKELKQLLKVQFSLRMQYGTQQLSNTSQLKKVRRDIARVKTVINLRNCK